VQTYLERLRASMRGAAAKSPPATPGARGGTGVPQP